MTGEAGTTGTRVRPGGGRSANPALVIAWIVWTALLLAAAILLIQGWRAGGGSLAAAGVSRLMWGLAAALLLPAVPLRALAGWRCARAVRRLPEAWRSGTEPLPAWPGVREKAGTLTMRCGGGALRLWPLSAGLVLSGVLAGQLGSGQGQTAGVALGVFNLALSLSPAVCAGLLSVLWGPSGWMLCVEAASSRAVLVLRRAMRRTLSSAVSLPTIQGVELVVPRRYAPPAGILVRRAKGGDWKLGVPGYWPPDLIEALAARLASLAGVEFSRAAPAAPRQSSPPPTPPAPPPEVPAAAPPGDAAAGSPPAAGGRPE